MLADDQREGVAVPVQRPVDAVAGRQIFVGALQPFGGKLTEILLNLGVDGLRARQIHLRNVVAQAAELRFLFFCDRIRDDVLARDGRLGFA